MRSELIDKAKAIALLMVLIGHTEAVPQSVQRVIYSFHMPAFFFISGLLLNDAHIRLSLRGFLKLQAYRLIVPYLFFGGVSIAYSAVTSRITHSPVSLTEDFIGLMYGNATDMPFNLVLWFFTCLFSTALLFFLLAKMSSVRSAAVLGILVSLIVCIIQPMSVRLPWNMDLAMVALAFYATGKLLARRELERRLRQHLRVVRALSILLVLALYIMANMNDRIDMPFLIFGNLTLFFLNAFIGITLLFCLASLVPDSFLYTFIARYTIVIFPMHPLLFSLFTGAGMILLGMPQDFSSGRLISAMYVFGALLLCWPLALILTSYLPSVLGGRGATSQELHDNV